MRRLHLVAGCPQKVNAVPVRPCRVRLRPRYMERASARRRCCCAACVCGRVARPRTAPGEKELSVRCCAAGPHQRSWSTFWLTSVESVSPTASVLLRGAIHGSRAKYPESGPPPALSCYRSDRSDDQEAVGRAAMSFIGDWADILQSLEEQRKKYGGTSIGDSFSLVVTGKGFRFPDEATARAIAQRFEDRAETMNERTKLINKALDALRKKFSEDEYSREYARDAMNSLRSLRALNVSAAKYAKNYSMKIRAAMDLKMSEEEGIGKSLGKIGGSVV